MPKTRGRIRVLTNGFEQNYHIRGKDGPRGGKYTLCGKRASSAIRSHTRWGYSYSSGYYRTGGGIVARWKQITPALINKLCKNCKAQMNG